MTDYFTQFPSHFPLYFPLPSLPTIYNYLLITRIQHLPQLPKILLQRPRTHKPHQSPDTSRLIIRPTPSRASKRLLPDHGTRTFAVGVEVARRVP